MVRSLLQRNAALATWLTDLGATGLAAAAALARLGTPPSDDLVRALAEAARQFAALRDEVLAAAATIELATPPADALASTRHLEPVLAALLERLQPRDRSGAAARAHAEALTVLDRVARWSIATIPASAPSPSVTRAPPRCARPWPPRGAGIPRAPCWRWPRRSHPSWRYWR